MKYNIFAAFFIYLFSFSAKSDFYDYSLGHIVDSCSIILKSPNPDAKPDEMIEGRKNYRVCYNFIMSLSTTLNGRCMNPEKSDLSPEEALTYADLSDVNSTVELVMEIIKYANNNPQFINQTAWLHAAKALSQKWPCDKL